MHSLQHTERKRKLSEDHTPMRVRFCSKPHEVIATYSPCEYDRSGLFPDVPPLSLYPNVIPATMVMPPSMDAAAKSMLSPPPSTCLPSPPIEQDDAEPWPATQAPTAAKTQRKRPKLTIDTSAIQGPLFFTDLSTNHQKKLKSTTTTPVATQFPSAPHREDEQVERITLKNTEINRRCCIVVVA
ncbi:hypothetical protein BC940DRAFT_304110 [Gongronella butleri]|nr:hypothetical protein BC940DRAFT_304110 [Gongronella butleri]